MTGSQGPSSLHPPIMISRRVEPCRKPGLTWPLTLKRPSFFDPSHSQGGGGDSANTKFVTHRGIQSMNTLMKFQFNCIFTFWEMAPHVTQRVDASFFARCTQNEWENVKIRNFDIKLQWKIPQDLTWYQKMPEIERNRPAEYILNILFSFSVMKGGIPPTPGP